MSYRGGSFNSFAPAGNGNMNGRRGAIPMQKNLSVDDSLGFVNEDGNDGTPMPQTVSGNGFNRPRGPNTQMMQAQQQQQMLMQQQQIMNQPIGYGASPARPRPMPMQMQGRPNAQQMMMPGAMPIGAPGPHQGGYGGPASPGQFQPQPQFRQGPAQQMMQPQMQQQQVMQPQMQMPQPQIQMQHPQQQQQTQQVQQQQQAQPSPMVALPSGAGETDMNQKWLELQNRIMTLETRVASGTQATTIVNGDVGLLKKELQSINTDLLNFNKRMDGYRDESKWFFCVVADNPEGHVKLYENYLKPGQEAATVPCGDFLLMHYPMKSSGDDIWIKCRVINPADAQLQTFWVKAYDGATRKRLVDNFGFTPKMNNAKVGLDTTNLFTQDNTYQIDLPGPAYGNSAIQNGATGQSTHANAVNAMNHANSLSSNPVQYKETMGSTFTSAVTEIPSAMYDARMPSNTRDTLTSMFAGAMQSA